MKIFLLEDDENLNSILCEYLEKKKYEVDTFLSSSEAMKHIHQEYDMYLLDLNLPDINGLEVLKNIRVNNKETPIMVISGFTDIKTVLEGYKLGCSDYLRKPFDTRELLAKIVALTNNSSKTVELHFECSFDYSTSSLYKSGKKIDLTKNEAKIISYLVKHKGRIVPKDTLAKHLWNEAPDKSDEAIRSAIFRLRRKIPKDLIRSHFDLGVSIP